MKSFSNEQIFLRKKQNCREQNCLLAVENVHHVIENRNRKHREKGRKKKQKIINWTC